ncbi:hypothetical protein AB0O80_10435 [Rothia kristinae]|uniref:hypothetical protein n=1 Tax=Actinomycetes TaxID=1760 RepID=UPI0034176CE4
MTKLTETLKAAGWVETTLGECWKGEEVLLTKAGHIARALRVTRPAGEDGCVGTSDGGIRLDTTPVLREPRPERPEYEPGTVALITWDEGDEHVRDLLPVRAMMGAEGAWHGAETDPPSESSRVEVVRVLLPADQDTPAVAVTDEMVERGAEACYFAREENPSFNPQWDEVCEKFPYAAALYRRDAHAVLKAALGGGES